MTRLTALFGWMTPGELRRFPLAEREAAIARAAAGEPGSGRTRSRRRARSLSAAAERSVDGCFVSASLGGVRWWPSAGCWPLRSPACGWLLLRSSSKHRGQRLPDLVYPRSQEPPVTPGCPAVRTDGRRVLVMLRVAVSSAPASLSQADLRRDLHSIQAAISPTTSRMSSVQPSAPNPPLSPGAGVPAADGVEVEVGGSAAADVAGGSARAVSVWSQGASTSAAAPQLTWRAPSGARWAPQRWSGVVASSAGRSCPARSWSWVPWSRSWPGGCRRVRSRNGPSERPRRRHRSRRAPGPDPSPAP
jgi:hypothetical protein